VEPLKASKLKKQCLAVLDHVDPEGIVITKHGKPMARLLPIASDCAELIGCMKGKLKITREVFSTGIRWDAQS
jgi:prevent-host-death family protein